MNFLPSYRTLLKAFAEASAQRNIVPDANAGFGMASIENGFPLETMRPIDDGGIAPQGQDINGGLHLATSGLVYMQHGGMGFRFYQPIADALGGYALGAVLAFDDPANPYCVMSTIPNNTINFNVEPASIGDEWALVPKIQQYNPAFNFPRGYMLTYQGEAYVCVTANGPGAGGVVLPGTNESVWMQLLGAGGAPDTGRFFVGMIMPMPNRFNELPTGWYACNGVRYADYLPQGQALLSLSPTYRADWGITLTADGINVPQLMGRPYFTRFVNGVTRLPGSIEEDAARPVSASASTTTATTSAFSANGGKGSVSKVWLVINSTASGVMTLTDPHNPESINEGGGIPHLESTLNVDLTGSKITSSSSSSTSVYVSQANQGPENRPLNIGMTPAIFLGA